MVKRRPTMKKLTIVVTLLLTSAFLALVGCEKKVNPLLTDRYVHGLKEMIAVDKTDKPVKTVCLMPKICGNGQVIGDPSVSKNATQCPPYLANPGSHPAVKAECDQWAEQYYKKLMNENLLPYNATLDEFKDPELWQAVLPK
jgi:hypothetical protein